MGQGIATTYAQLVVDTFGVPIDKIRIVMGDTDRGQGFGSAGSRSLFTAGSAIEVAAKQAVKTGKDLAGEALEAAAADIEYAEGVFQVAGTDKRIGLFELAAKQPAHVVFAVELLRIPGGTILWQGEYAETQQALTENLWNLPGFVRAGAKWVRASELASLGADEIARLAREGVI